MRHETPPQSLEDLVLDIAQSENQRRAQEAKAKLEKDQAFQIYKQAELMMRQFGREKKTVAGVSGSPGSMGLRMENVTNWVTPPVETTLNKTKAQLELIKQIDHQVRYSIQLTVGDSKEPVTQKLFSILQDSMLNWKNEPASLEDMAAADEILDFMGEALARTHRMNASHAETSRS